MSFIADQQRIHQGTILSVIGQGEVAYTDYHIFCFFPGFFQNLYLVRPKADYSTLVADGCIGYYAHAGFEAIMGESLGYGGQIVLHAVIVQVCYGLWQQGFYDIKLGYNHGAVAYRINKAVTGVHQCANLHCYILHIYPKPAKTLSVQHFFEDVPLCKF